MRYDHQTKDSDRRPKGDYIDPYNEPDEYNVLSAEPIGRRYAACMGSLESSKDVPCSKRMQDVPYLWHKLCVQPARSEDANS